MQTKVIKLTHKVWSKCIAEFPVKGFGLSPQDSSRLRVKVLYEALLVQHKSGHTQTISSIWTCAI